MADKTLVMVGYSGHGYVVAETAISAGFRPIGYFDKEEKKDNPYQIAYLGDDETSMAACHYFIENHWIVAIGDNRVRARVQEAIGLISKNKASTLIHAAAVVSNKASLGSGVLVAARAVIQPLAQVGDGAICNTGCIIEHECAIGHFAHIAPGAILAGNVRVGKGSFIGAGAVVKHGVVIGDHCTIGAGAVVLRDVADGDTVVGNPARIIRSIQP